MMLDVEDLNTYYGTSHILQGVSLTIAQGEAVCLLGRNGAGKSTTFKSIIGLQPPRKGKILFKGINITKCKPFQISRLGIGYVPEDRRIYPDLTIQENIEIGYKLNPENKSPWTLKKIYEIFPKLESMADRKGRQMSGGEQQMLTIARSLMTNPDLLLLDEPSEGLAPIVVADVGRLIQRIKEEGMSILLAEQNTVFSLKLVERAYIIEKGQIQWQGNVDALCEDDELFKKYLCV